ncbi:hypothetical protein RF11_15271 [Thelohanellus kitauei]|uniref:CCHC-type domain-containing protein n=1 Tax=Thelohanellus kitauei TaxID=669202 RepID=A0A0C2JCA9_THEKT|nr:hypothetical protein RF11_15271 [Thelohanellus kitauei]
MRCRFHSVDINDDEKKKLYLLNFIGSDGYSVLVDIYDTCEVSEVPYKDILRCLTRYYGKEIPRERRTTEDTKSFIRELKKLANGCRFGGQLEERVRDQIICGINDERIEEELMKVCENPEVSLSKIEDTALYVEGRRKGKGVENGISVHRVDRRPKQNPVKSINRNTTCIKCGRPKHGNAAMCPAAKSKCYLCGGLGHFKQVCIKSGMVRVEPARTRGSQNFIEDNHEDPECSDTE